MNKIKMILMLALLAGTGAARAQDPPAQVGRLSYVQGTVSFAPADAGSDWIAAPVNWPVTSGDRLWADRDGLAEMRIGANAIRAGALTSVDVLRLDDMGTQLRLAQGTLNIRVRQLEPTESFEVSTPAGTVLLSLPGSYRLSVDPAGAATTVLVRQGQADVLTGNAPVPVNDNQRFTFSAATLDFATAPPPDEFDNWAYARDRQNENLITPRYVSPAMTGYEELDQHGAWQSVAQYGNVWFPTTVAVGWAPYRYGRWVWVSPWGWTWVDNAPWGFAPYHYGRWVWIGGRWAWAPGARVARPVYAPALVAFIGGSNLPLSVTSGPAVGWVPLGWHEPYIPWYRHTPAYVRNVNVMQVTNVTVINQYTNVTNVHYANRAVPAATTVVTRDTFTRARQVQDAHLNVPASSLAAAQITHAMPVENPGGRHSFANVQPSARPPAAIAAREVVTTRVPSALLPHVAPEERPRVRVLGNVPSFTPAPAATRVAPDAPPPIVPTPAAREVVTTRAPSALPHVAPEERPRVRVLGNMPSSTPAPAAARAAPDAPPPIVPAPAPRERAAERLQPQIDATQPAPPRPRVTTAVPVAPVPATTSNDALLAQQQHERQARDEQQRQARALRQQHLEQQKAQQHQELQQRALAVQQQRERQFQQAQQVEQQRQAQRLLRREERPAVGRPAPTPPPQPHPAAKPKPEGEHGPPPR